MRQLAIKTHGELKEATDVAVTCKLEFDAHTGDVGRAHVGTVHQTDAVHGANSDDEATINAPHNGSLLLLREAMADILAVLTRKFAWAVDVAKLPRLLQLTSICGSHGWFSRQCRYEWVANLGGVSYRLHQQGERIRIKK